MEWEYILLRYGEIFLKGKNKSFFESRLYQNIKKIAGVSKIQNIRGRLITTYFPDHLKLKQVFGLVSYSPAIKVEKEMEAIKLRSVELLKDKKGTFKIEPKRSDKRFPLTSPEINIELGRFIEKNTTLTFNGENPDHLIGVEINQEGAYLFLDIINCFGGLPTGVEGKVAILIENEASLLSALLFMKRGCDIILLGFKEKDISLLQRYSPISLKLNLVDDLNHLRRFLDQSKLDILVSGQSFDTYEKIDVSFSVLRPLIAYKKEEISQKLEEYKSEV